MAPFGITVNNVLPGYTRTERLDELAEATARRTGETSTEFYARLDREIPMRRVGDPRELAVIQILEDGRLFQQLDVHGG